MKIKDKRNVELCKENIERIDGTIELIAIAIKHFGVNQDRYEAITKLIEVQLEIMKLIK